MRNGQDVALEAAQQIYDLMLDVEAAEARIGLSKDEIPVRYGALSVVVKDITIRRLRFVYTWICYALSELEESELPTDNNALSAEKDR